MLDYTSLTLSDFTALWPSIILAAGGLVTLLLEVTPPSLRRLAGPFAILTTVGPSGTSRENCPPL